MNESPFRHVSRYGTVFECDGSDLRSGVRVSNRPDSLALYSADLAEMIAFHAIHVWPNLNGFAGYDTVCFEGL